MVMLCCRWGCDKNPKMRSRILCKTFPLIHILLNVKIIQQNTSNIFAHHSRIRASVSFLDRMRSQMHKKVILRYKDACKKYIV